MGILDFLKPKAIAKQITPEEARKLSFEAVEREERELEDFSSKRFAEVKHLLLSLSRSADELEATKLAFGDDVNERVRSVVMSSQKNLVRQIRGLSKKLSPPSAFSYDSLRSYSSDALNAVNNGLLPYWKNILLAKLMLKEEVKKVGNDLEELSKVFQELHARAFSKKVESLFFLRIAFGKLDSLEQESSSLASAEREQRQRISAAKSSLSSAEEKLAAIHSSPDAKRVSSLESELASLEQKKRSLADGFATLIAPSQKILKKMLSSPEGKSALSPEEAKIAQSLIDSPASVLSSDQSGKLTKNVFSSARTLVASGAISMKDGKEREKRLASIDSILAKDFFSDYFWELNRVQAEIVSLRGKISAVSISRDITRLKSDVDSAQHSTESEKQALTSLLSRREKNASEKARHIAVIGQRLSVALGGAYSLKP